MARQTAKTKTRSALELARSVGSPVARASHTRSGGAHGKHGQTRNRHDRRAGRQRLRSGAYDD